MTSARRSSLRVERPEQIRDTDFTLNSTIGDDSAPRAMAAYSMGSVKVLNEIAKANGWDTEADDIVLGRLKDRIGEDTAWQDAQGNVGAMFQIILIFAQHHPEDAVRSKARSIGSEISTSMIGEDSALRAQSRQWEGFINALHMLIENPQ